MRPNNNNTGQFTYSLVLDVALFTDKESDCSVMHLPPGAQKIF